MDWIKREAIRVRSHVTAMKNTLLRASNFAGQIGTMDVDICLRRFDDARRQALSLAFAIVGLLASTAALLAGAALSLVWL